MNRWLVTGAAGMLGHELCGELRAGGEDVTGLNRAELDVCDRVMVADAIARYRPDVVVNCAAWTAVDDAESREADALAVNAAGPANLADACADTGAVLVQVSTDYVFDGSGAGRPYAEDDIPAPRTAYGRTKLAGERAVLARLPQTGYVVRTAWLYGAHGPNFVRTMIRLERERDTVDVVDDQQGQPTWTADVADQIIALARSGRPGIYHATSSGQTTWYELARSVFMKLGSDPGRVHPVGSQALARPAPRPSYSVLGHQRWAGTGIAPIRDWRLALDQAFPALAFA
jgi:dTDP-4-dehydrorhamnose reductase